MCNVHLLVAAAATGVLISFERANREDEASFEENI